MPLAQATADKIHDNVQPMKPVAKHQHQNQNQHESHATDAMANSNGTSAPCSMQFHVEGNMKMEMGFNVAGQQLTITIDEHDGTYR